LHLTARDDKKFWREGEGKDGRDQHAKECYEAANVTTAKVRLHCTWILPVAKPKNAILIGSATPKDNE